MHDYKSEMTFYGMHTLYRCTPMRDALMRRPCEKHVYERRAYEKHAYETVVYERDAHQ